MKNRSIPGWVFLLLIVLVAAGMRFWQLGEAPPGLYRDEAYNGLDALDVLDGHNALFFPRNNGREPVYINLTAVSVALFGRSAFSVRLPAAVIGTLTTVFVFLLGRSWFGRHAGLAAALLWAITVWPVHLGRIGLRVGLLVLPLAAAAWLATEAVRATRRGEVIGSRARWLWLAAGACYGAAFYTYLASRFTPILVGCALLLWFIRERDRRLWSGLLWAGLAAGLLLLPWLWLGVQAPELFLGRSGQVSILNADINKGDFWGALWEHSGRALGLFLIRGDTIIRHNPAGRPLFDLFMAVPFAVGLIWLVRRWRRPSAWATLLWVGIMLWPTILAEDTPHFLRAVGIFPAVLFIPAVGLSRIATWPKLGSRWRTALVAALLLGSWGQSVGDYFYRYTNAADTAFLFEAAARRLAEEIAATPAEITVAAAARYREGWPSVPFLLDSNREVQWLAGGQLPDLSDGRAARLYLWPHDGALAAIVPAVIEPPALLTAVWGPQARGDLEKTPYALYARYEITPGALAGAPAAIFQDPAGPGRVRLQEAAAHRLNAREIAVALTWSTEIAGSPNEPLTVFVHVQNLSSGGLIGQHDGPPAEGLVPSGWWRPGLFVTDTHVINLSEPFDAARHQILVGLYPSGSPQSPWALPDKEGNFKETHWIIHLTE